MKQLLVILFALLIGSQQTIAQGSKKLESFRKNVMPGYSMYFDQAGVTENGQLNLSALANYTGLPADEKKAIMSNIIEDWQDSLVLVHYGSKRELWGRSFETGNIRLLDEFDLNSPPLNITAKTGSPSYPWFVYVGGQLGGDSQHNINLALNLRVGFYLLLNRLDFATTLSGGLTGNTSYLNSGTGWGNVGLMSRVHFPIKKIRLSPNVGGEISMAVFGNTPLKVTGSLVLGVSWFVGFGSLDIGIHIGNIISGSGGYTMSPQIKRNR